MACVLGAGFASRRVDTDMALFRASSTRKAAWGNGKLGRGTALGGIEPPRAGCRGTVLARRFGGEVGCLRREYFARSNRICDSLTLAVASSSRGTGRSPDDRKEQVAFRPAGDTKPRHEVASGGRALLQLLLSKYSRRRQPWLRPGAALLGQPRAGTRRRGGKRAAPGPTTRIVCGGSRAILVPPLSGVRLLRSRLRAVSRRS